MGKFNAGDTVERINYNNFTQVGIDDFRVGDRGVVVEESDDWYDVKMEKNGVISKSNASYNLLLVGEKVLNEQTKEIPMVTHLLTTNSITLIYDGKHKVIARGDQRFDLVITALREGRQKDIPALVEPERELEKAGMKVVDGLVEVKGEAMPPELNARILEYQANKLPFHSLLRFWENLKQNPSFNSRKQLFKFLENQGHSLTEDGCFIGYRGVTEDFKDKHSRTFDNSPGKVCEMPRELVDDNPDNTCSFGLHVGGFNYAQSFGPKLVLVKVNPKDVVAVPNDYNGQKMRVCRFEVLKEAEQILIDTVVSSSGGEYNADEDEWNDDDFENDDNEPFEDSEGQCEDCGQYEVSGLNDENVCVDCEQEQEEERNDRYANNHNKRDKSGRFVSKKKRK